VPFAREVLSPARLAAQGIVDAGAAGRVLDAHVAGREDLSRQLWGLMCLSLWAERMAVPGRQAA
jgi:asparagine synthase (glutamine-hydrolysing)